MAWRNPMSSNYRIIYEDTRPEFIKLLLKGTPASEYELSGELSPDEIRNATLKKAITAEFSSYHPVWKRLIGHYPHPVVELTMPNGKFTLVRNGNNLGLYNYAILEHSKKIFHWAQNVPSALCTIEMLGCNRNDLPLLMGRVPENLQTEFERRLKEP